MFVPCGDFCLEREKVIHELLRFDLIIFIELNQNWLFKK